MLTPQHYIEKLAKNGCRRCGHCCSYDSGIFLDEDIRRIAGHLGMPEDSFRRQFLEEKDIYNKKVHKAKLDRKDKPFGPCIFFDKESGCSIHEVKPLHCRLSLGCGEYGQQINIWFMLNHVVDADDPEAIRQWAQYLKTHPTIPGGQLHELVPDKDKLARMLSYEFIKREGD